MHRNVIKAFPDHRIYNYNYPHAPYLPPCFTYYILISILLIILLSVSLPAHKNVSR